MEQNPCCERLSGRPLKMESYNKKKGCGIIWLESERKSVGRRRMEDWMWDKTVSIGLITKKNLYLLLSQRLPAVSNEQEKYRIIAVQTIDNVKTPRSSSPGQVRFIGKRLVELKTTTRYLWHVRRWFSSTSCADERQTKTSFRLFWRVPVRISNRTNRIRSSHSAHVNRHRHRGT